jgi:ABC-type bacteriocin/lantibiotic exporter with double-glycine peptidase domain
MKIPVWEESGKSEVGMLEMFRYLIKNLDKNGDRDWKILAFSYLLSPIVDVFSFSIMIYIINKVTNENKASPELILFTLCMVGISTFKCLFEIYKSKISNRFLYDGAQKLSMKIYEMLLKEELTEHNQKSAMQVLTMVRHDTTNCIQIIVSCIKVWTNCITLAGYAAVLIYVTKWVGVVSGIVLVLFMALIFRQTHARMLIYGEKSRKYSIRTNAQITIAYGSFKEMKIDDRSALVLKKYQDASTQYAQIQGEYQYKSNSMGVLLQNSVMGAMFLILAVILTAGSNLAVIFAPLVVYVTALIRMLPLAHNILSGLNSVEFGKKSYGTLKKAITSYMEYKAEEEKSKEVRQKNLTFLKGLSVRNLTFGYREDVKLFDNASIDIPVGCSVAIIGVSGVGKTTFLDLILGLLKPQSGNIFYDDYDIVSHTDQDGVCRADVGQLVSYIPQTVYLNGETIQNNVAFFEEEDQIEEDRVVECLKCAQIWEDVKNMPDGLNTLIGENGLAISGGQRQRIALARALYKDFELLVMDEATVALDMETEKAVIDSIREIKKNKTLLMVTHHMSLANECDHIYRIENKKIVQVK